MKITIFAIGKIKEKYLQSGIDEFVKRLTPFCKLEIKEYPETKISENPSAEELKQALQKEGEQILLALSNITYVILLDLHGKQISSENLADKFSTLAVNSTSHITFIIGGTFGLSDKLRSRADFSWSLSSLTFTHQMIRLFLVEQIYRAFKIWRGEKYHW